MKEIEQLVKVALDSDNALPAASPMRSELILLKPLLTPMSKDVTIEVLEENLAKFQDDKQLKLHKVMANFPTGLLILRAHPKP